MASKQQLLVSILCLFIVIDAALAAKDTPAESTLLRVKRGKKLAMAGGALAGAFIGNKLHKAGKSHRVKRGKKLAMAGGALAGAFIGNKLHKAGKKG